jgi:hypothetical protein
VLLLLMMAWRHVSASASLLQRSSSSRSTVRTLMQYGYPLCIQRQNMQASLRAAEHLSGGRVLHCTIGDVHLALEIFARRLRVVPDMGQIDTGKQLIC